MKEIKGRTYGWLARALAILALAAPGAAFAQAATALWYQTGNASPVVKRYPTSTVTLSGTNGLVHAAFANPGTNFEYNVAVDIGAVSGQPLTPGSYNAMPYRDYYSPYSPTAQGAFPLVFFNVDYGYSSGCTGGSAHFNVLEASFDGNQVIRFAADFEYRCYGETTIGELRINSAFPLTVDKPAGTTTPDPIAFPARVLVAPGSEVLSDTQRIRGINAPAAISVSGGAYSINGGPFTTDAGTVNNRDTVRLLMNAPSALAASTSMQVDVGGRSATFTASTYGEGTPLTLLKMQGTAGDRILQGSSVLAAGPEWVSAVTLNDPSYASLQFRKADGTTFIVSVSTGAARTTGEFDSVISASASNPTVGLGVFGLERSCEYYSPGAAHFRIFEYSMAGASLGKLAMDFEYACAGQPPLRGELRYNSTWPVASLKVGGDTTPEPFSFASRTNQVAGSLVESQDIAIYGINAPASISVAGGEYSINSGAYTSAPGTVSAFDRVRVRVTASTNSGGIQTARLTVGGVQADFSATTYLTGTPLRALHLEGGGNLDILPGSGVTLTYAAATAATFQFSTQYGIGTISFTAPAALANGMYESAATSSNGPGRPYVSINVPGINCNASSARFVIFDALYSGTTFTRFAANFQLWCENIAPIYGEIRYDSGIVMMRYDASGDATPDPFAFPTREPMRAGQLTVSNRVGVYGINTSVPISISGGEYSKNGGAFTSQPGTAVARDDIVVRVISPWTAGATQTATLNVGGAMATFSARTYTPGELLTGLDIPVAASPITAPRFYIAPADSVTPSIYSGTRSLQFTISGPGGDSTSVRIEAPYNSVLSVGTVVQARRSPDATYGAVEVSTGYGYCYNQGVGEFVVREIAFDGFGTLTRAAVDFRYACDPTAPMLKGELRYRSTIPFSRYQTPSLVRKRDGFDANNDGRNDVLFQHTDGRAAIWLMDGPYTIGAGNLVPAGTGWSIAMQGDFDGDGKSDLLWKHTDGRVAMWLMNGSSLTAAATLIGAGTGWTPKLVADFNGDGKADILWEHTDGRTAMWLMNGTTLTGAATLINAGTGWSATLAGDLNGDGKADILWTHTDGRPSIWLMNGTQIINGGVLFTAGTGWTAKLLADVNGDGKADIVWWNTDGRVSIWLMNGMTALGVTQVMNAGNAYVPDFSSDINGDGKADIVWRSSDGSAIFWLMDGASQIGGGQILAAGTGWTVTRAADFSGDLIGDLILVHTDGRVRMDLFDGLGFTASSTLLNPGSGWTPVPIR